MRWHWNLKFSRNFKNKCPVLLRFISLLCSSSDFRIVWSGRLDMTFKASFCWGLNQNVLDHPRNLTMLLHPLYSVIKMISRFPNNEIFVRLKGSRVWTKMLMLSVASEWAVTDLILNIELLVKERSLVVRCSRFQEVVILSVWEDWLPRLLLWDF